MFQKVDEPNFVAGEHEMLRFWHAQDVFRKLQAQNADKPHWSFLDGPITANNPMGVHHAWGRTYKDAFQRYRAMTGRKLRYQNGFDCQGLWVEVEVEKELNLGTKTGIADYGIDRFVRECKKRVLKFAARQTEQSVRLGYWMEWDEPDELRRLADGIGEDSGFGIQDSGKSFSGEPSATPSLPTTRHPLPTHTYRTARGQTVTAPAEQIAAQLGNPAWGGSYFTFSTENNETIWAFLKKCFERKKIYQGHDVMPWSGRAGSAYSQMEVADGRKLTTHRSCFVRLRLLREDSGPPFSRDPQGSVPLPTTQDPQTTAEYLLVWTTTPWTLTSNVACAVNPELEYVKLRAKKDGAVYYFAKDNLEYKRLEKEFKEGFGRPEWGWPEGVGKLKSIAQIFKEQGGYEIEDTLKGADMVGWRYEGPFDEIAAQKQRGGHPQRVVEVEELPGGGALEEIAIFLGTEAVQLEPWTLVPGHGGEFTRPDYDDSEIYKRLQAVLLQHGLTLERSEARGKEFEAKHGSLFDGFGNWVTMSDRDRRRVREECANTLLNQVRVFCRLIESILDDVRNANWFQCEIPQGADLPALEYFFANLGLESRYLSSWHEVRLLQKKFAEIREGNTDEDIADGDGERLLTNCGGFLYALMRELQFLPWRSAVSSHHVKNGGRDSKGNAIVVAGEGTGIVHIAPGCGDVDHQIGKQLGLPIIAPLGEDGTFGEGFGPFTGKRATDPDTAQLVFDSLKDKGLLVAVETYPHIYPFCWRTGDELVFRLVDEWFINMDWREEIKEVVDTIEWLPPSIEGREREREWLTNMRDWMISKKRFWGLALPIWVNPDDPTDFEVIGSLAELKERAQEVDRLSLMVDRQKGEVDKPSTINHKPLPSGWDEFEGHTPHRPWIDAVKIRSRRTGAVLSRIVDVGNPWLDAGIVPFSTLNYNEWEGSRESGDESREKNPGADAARLANSEPSALRWPEWYPPEFVVECFPGQFRNWFYSLLALSTMMRYDETEDPAEKRPFQTLLGHRLVMNEDGKPMHKSDGTAIWFEEAAEQLGVDTLRWLYLAQDPASDLRFGTRHKDEPVTLPTVDGPLSHTREGLPCCRVTSKPADEVRRQVLIPLWNSYAFFVNYARLDGFDPSLPEVPVAERPEIDRWILSNLQTLLKTANERFCAYDAAAACKAAATFVDDLSNWYIRRNRRRFWRSRKESVPDASSVRDAGWDPDKLAAYQTLYTVLVTLTKALAPIVPFLAERMYLNLVFGESRETRDERREQRSDVRGQTSVADLSTLNSQLSTHRQPTTDDRQPVSVHLCSYPQPDESLIDAALNARMATAQRVVSMGLRLRDAKDLRVRQPLAELRYAATNELAAQIAALEDVIDDELNVKSLRRVEHLDDLVRYTYKPNLKTLGPKYGKLLNALRTKLPELGDAVLRPLRTGQAVTTAIDGTEVTLQPEDVLITTEQAGEWSTADEPGLQIALSMALTPELIHEGMARDFVRHVQQARKDADLEITDRIRVWYSGPAEVTAAVDAWREYIVRETLADAVKLASTASAEGKSVAIGESEGWVWIERA